jgi:hypothetical protein
MLQGADDRGELGVDVACDEVIDGQGSALVGYVCPLHFPHPGQKLARKMAQ